MREFSVIAAVDKNFGIGRGGKLPWTLKGDLGHFKAVTTRQVVLGKLNAVIMGRATWDSLPERSKPLVGRLNVVLSRQTILELPPGVQQAASLNSALQKLDEAAVGEVFIIGGGSVYAEAVQHPDCQTIYLTEVDSAFDCDTFFPDIPHGFHKMAGSEPITEGGITYHFVVYERQS